MTGKPAPGGVPLRAGGMELRCGANGPLRAAPFLVSVPAMLAICVSPAGVSWKGVLLCALVLTTWSSARAARDGGRPAILQITPEGSIRLGLDGATPAPAALRGNPWTCRWFSILKLFVPESGIHYHGVICASGNRSADYRRLLGFLRMRSPTPDPSGALWF